MATWDDVRALAAAMPGVEEFMTRGDRAWKAGPSGKLFVWERPLRARDLEETGAQDGPIVGIRVGDEGEKQAVIASDVDVFFTIHHFDGYNAVLVNLDRISRERLAEVITDSWIVVAPKKLVSAYLAARS
ncbi:MAG TPA: MmcQ/YjbR family DNA-binding protein [Pseudolysinimonas sp.]